MKKIIFSFILLIFLCTHLAAQSTPQTLTPEEVNEWYQKQDWVSGLQIQPDAYVNKEILAR